MLRLLLSLLVLICASHSFTLRHGMPDLYVPSDLDPEKVIATDEWAVRLTPEADARSVAEAHGFQFLSGIGNLKHTFLLKEIPNRSRFSFLPLNYSKHVAWAERQVLRQREKRAFFSDPQYASQWHIHGTSGRDMKIESAWELGYQGEGCQIAVVDDGLERLNPDLAANYDAEGSYDFNYGDTDPTPDRSADTHGTSAAGCSAAAANNVCGVGSAPKAKLSGIRLISAAASDALEANALSFKIQRNDIFTNSWGPNDDGRTIEGPGRLLNAAMTDAIVNGREGKGTIYVWAGGNGRQYGDDGNYDGYNNKPYTISIGAYDYGQKQAYYSEPCACLHAVAPSSGSSGPMITTTAVTSHNGCTSQFGGTSAAAPMVAGVVCLLLNVRNDLTWRDVQGIIINSASPIDSSSSWQQNGAGFHFSHSYGFGKIDVERMMEIAPTWELMAPQVYLDSGVFANTGNQGTVSAGSNKIFEINSPLSITIEHVVLLFDVTILRRGDLSIDLISPSGTVSHMMSKHTDTHSNLLWVTTSNACWGENSEGVWQIKFTNGGTTGMNVVRYQLFIEGTQNA